jgi:hypothetical protein
VARAVNGSSTGELAAARFHLEGGSGDEVGVMSGPSGVVQSMPLEQQQESLCPIKPINHIASAGFHTRGPIQSTGQHAGYPIAIHGGR